MKILAIIYLILKVSVANAQVLLSIKSETEFPHLMENPFSMQIQPLNKNLELSVDAADTMVIRIVDSNYIEVERAILIYGAQHSMDEEFLGKCMDIKIWEKNPSSTEMNISIMFKRNAHNKYLEIFYFSAQNKFQRKNYLKNLTLAKRLFHKVIDLLIPSKLSLLVHPIGANRKEIIINDLVMASCRAFDGIPKEKPKFGNYFHLNVTVIKYNEKDNEIKMYFHVSLRDHFSYFTCMAGNLTEMYTIRINHHPTKLNIHPIITKRLLSNSTIKCLAIDGYPDPEINWHFIEGPPNEDLFYKIIGNRHQIHINSNSPIGSKWTFKCTAKSYLAKTHKILNKIISFVIDKNPMEICDGKCLNLRFTEIEELVVKNSKLHDEIKNVLNEVKQQLKSQVIEQREMSNKFKEKLQMINLNIKDMNHSIQNFDKTLNYNFDKISYESEESPKFPSVYPLSVQIWNEFLDKQHLGFRFRLIFTNKKSITAFIKMKYICWISAIRSPNIKKLVIFDIEYSGEGQYVTNIIGFPSDEIFGSDLFVDTRCNFKCTPTF